MKILNIKSLNKVTVTIATSLLGLFGTSLLAAEPGLTSTTIKIGMFGPMTGTNSVGSLTVVGASAIYKNINDQGGIHGRKIELIVEDDACDPNKTIAAVKKLISQDEVFMIHGGWCSGTVLAAKPDILRQPTMPFMVLGAASAAISTPVEANIFQPVATTNTVAKAMVDFALSKPEAKRIAIISHSDEWGKSHLDPILSNLKVAGIEPVETVYLERGAADATSQILRIRTAKPDFVLAVLYSPELAIYMRDSYKYNVKAPTVTTQGVSIEDMVKRVGIPAATKELYVFYPLSDTQASEGMKKWSAIFEKYNPKTPVETLSFLGMTGALAVIDTLQKIGPDLTRAKVLAQFNQITAFNPGIQSGSLTFTPQQHAGISTGKVVYMPEDRPVIVGTYPQSK